MPGGSQQSSPGGAMNLQGKAANNTSNVTSVYLRPERFPLRGIDIRTSICNLPRAYTYKMSNKINTLQNTVNS